MKTQHSFLLLPYDLHLSERRANKPTSLYLAPIVDFRFGRRPLLSRSTPTPPLL